MSGIFTMSPEGYHPVIQIFQDFYMGRMQANHYSGGAAGEKRQNAARRAFKEGVSIGLAAYGNSLRASRYISLDKDGRGVPMLVSQDFESWLDVMAEQYGEDVRSVTDHAERKQAEQLFVGMMLDNFNGAVYTEVMETELVENRQAAILTGEIVAETPEEKEWLEEQLEKRRAETERIEDLLFKSRNPKVNTGG